MLAASVSPTGRPARVAVKIQFPDIAESVASDLGYIRILLTAGRLLPRGLFLDKTLDVRCIPHYIAICTARWGADDDVLKTGHEGRAGGRMQLHARGGLYALFRKPGEARQ